MFVGSVKVSELLANFCIEHSLPAHYADMADRWFLPLAKELNVQQNNVARPMLIGINGCQGSGKSTLAALLVEVLQQGFQKRVLALSIDDFYLTREQREQLAKDVQPLFLTRGVPGTHDTHLLQHVIKALTQPSGKVAVPRFDKSIDDRLPKAQWDQIEAPVDIVILEGWCVGSEPEQSQALTTPMNALERDEDPEATWRRYSNDALASVYKDLFAQLDYMIMLKAPSFDCVYQWRKKQEQKLRDKVGADAAGVMNDAELNRFIEHYQRITEHTLQRLPRHANAVFTLSEAHQITDRYDNPVAEVADE